MADLSAVEEALLALVGSIVYPSGFASPSITGTPIKLFRGWPETQQLNKDIPAGTSNVSVFSMPGGSRNLSRYSRDWHQLPSQACTLTVSVSGNSAAFDGDAAVGQLAAVSAARIGFVYAVQSGDTPAVIAAALVAQITSDGRLVGAASGATITITDPLGLALPVTAITAATGTAWRETRRQEQRLMVTAWCPTPELRDALSAAIDNALSDVDWLDAGDPTLTRIRYFSTSESDVGTNASNYRRDLHFVVEYPTIQTQTSAPLLYATGLLHALDVDITAGTQSPVTGVLSPDTGQDVYVDAGGNLIVQPTP